MRNVYKRTAYGDNRGGMMKTITRDDLKKKMDAGEKFKLIDVLSAQHFSEEHLPRAINIPLGEIEARAEELEKDEEIVVYCASFECTASTAAAEKLEALGFTNVLDYEGGIKDWKEAGYELEGVLAE